MEKLSDKKVFLLGIGCQKGGTTWLAHYLRHHPNVNLGMRKEYHIFDVMYLGICRNTYEQTKREAASGAGPRANSAAADASRLLTFYNDVEEYFLYFDEVWRERAITTVVGDITPSYAALPEQAFSMIKEKLQRYQFRVRVMFLLRDPFDRVCSTVRFNRRRKMKKGLEPQTTLEDDIQNTYNKRSCTMRTEYEKTIDIVENVFCQEEMSFAFYEELFRETEIRRITQFLGVPYQKPDLGTVINASPEQSQISEATRLDVIHRYRNTYEYIADKFGWDRVASVWPNIKFLSERERC